MSPPGRVIPAAGWHWRQIGDLPVPGTPTSLWVSLIWASSAWPELPQAVAAGASTAVRRETEQSLCPAQEGDPALLGECLSAQG